MTREQDLITTLANTDKKYTPDCAYKVQDMLDELKGILLEDRCCNTCLEFYEDSLEICCNRDVIYFDKDYNGIAFEVDFNKTVCCEWKTKC